ncbi:MAG: hypothetical protein KDB79_11925, partial [Acidobacteria bacterium]|nr:hypothetical protein [Acidobacteriota bacterium]
MNLIRCLTVIAAAMAFTFVARSQDPPPPPLIFAPPTASELQKFSPPDASFEAVFSGVPKMSTQNNVGAHTDAYTATNHGLTTVVSVVRLTETVKSVLSGDELFEKVKDALLKPAGTRLISQTPVTFDGYRSMDYEVADTIGYTKTRVIPVNEKIFEITINVTNWSLLSEAKRKSFEDEAARFYSSFKINSAIDPSLIAGETVSGNSGIRRANAEQANWIGEEDADGWREYRFDPLGGAVKFPAEPAMETAPFETGLITAVMTSYTSTGDSQGYIFAEVNLGFSATADEFRKDMYDGWQSGLAEAFAGGKMDQFDIDVAGKPARKLVGGNDRIRFEAIGVLVDGRLYQLMVVSAKTAAKPESSGRDKVLSAKFFESFRTFPAKPGAVNTAEPIKKYQVIGEEPYKNKEFGFTISLPLGWNEVGDRGARQSLERIRNNDKSVNSKGKESLTQSAARTTFLFQAVKPLSVSGRSASFLCVVESVPISDLDSKTIAEASEENFIANMGYKSFSRLKVVNINGTIFYRIWVRKDINGTDLKQILYMRKAKGKILQFGISYVEDADLETMERS